MPSLIPSSSLTDTARLFTHLTLHTYLFRLHVRWSETLAHREHHAASTVLRPATTDLGLSV
eukprot:1156618-Rhodomonas_salina.2